MESNELVIEPREEQVNDLSWVGAPGLRIVKYNGKEYASVKDYADFKKIGMNAAYARISNGKVNTIKFGGLTLIELIKTYV